MSIIKYKKSDGGRVSEHFALSEFACKGNDCLTLKLDEGLVVLLEKIRAHFGAPVIINSAYRCAAHNKRVGGSANSYHTKGMAADIVVRGIKPLEVAKYAESIGVKGIGLYESFVHIDTREQKFFWFSAKEEPRSTFGGNRVKDWQEALMADGFKLTFGADGIWGAECEKMAKKAVCKRQAVGYRYKNLTAIIQRAVGVEADGKFGKQTRLAVISWQRANGLTADGVIGYNSWKRMLGVSADGVA